MKLYRARAWRAGPATFDPLDSSGSIGGAGWRFNDVHTEVLYTAEVEALAVLEVAVRPGWETVRQVLIGTIELPDGLVVEPRDLGILLPSNWNARPVAPDSRSIAREFLDAIAGVAVASRPIGLRVPSVLSNSDHNVLIDPSRTGLCSGTLSHRYSPMRRQAPWVNMPRDCASWRTSSAMPSKRTCGFGAMARSMSSMEPPSPRPDEFWGA